MYLSSLSVRCGGKGELSHSLLHMAEKTALRLAPSSIRQACSSRIMAARRHCTLGCLHVGRLSGTHLPSEHRPPPSCNHRLFLPRWMEMGSPVPFCPAPAGEASTSGSVSVLVAPGDSHPRSSMSSSLGGLDSSFTVLQGGCGTTDVGV